MVMVDELFEDGFWYLCEWDGEPHEEWPPIIYMRSNHQEEVEELAYLVNEKGLNPWSLLKQREEA